jgi:hypothetical protein
VLVAQWSEPRKRPVTRNVLQSSGTNALERAGLVQRVSLTVEKTTAL